MKSKRDQLNFEQAKALIYLLCDAARIPVPSVRKVDAVGYEGEQAALEVRLREENEYGTVIHEWLHYVFELIVLERIFWKDTMDEYDNYEHRVIMFLEPFFAGMAKQLYKKAEKKIERIRYE